MKREKHTRTESTEEIRETHRAKSQHQDDENKHHVHASKKANKRSKEAQKNRTSMRKQ